MPRVKSTGTVKSVHNTTIPVGLHRLKVSAIKWARKENGDQLANSNGEVAIDIFFTDSHNRTAAHRFWMTDAAMWALDNLRKATGTYFEDQQTPVSKIVGKECYAIIAGEFFFTDEKLSRNEKGEPLMMKQLVPKFSPIVGNILPANMDDPKRNNGVPAGDFLVNKGLHLEEYFTEDDRQWMLKQCGIIPIKESLVKQKVASDNKLWEDVNDDF